MSITISFQSQIASDTPIFTDELESPPPGSITPWRIGKGFEKAPIVYMRVATANDQAENPVRDQDLFRKNMQLRKSLLES